MQPLIERLPYSEELTSPHQNVISAHFFDKHVELAIAWLRVLEERSAQHADLRAEGRVHFLTGHILFLTGEREESLSRFQRGLALTERTGNAGEKCFLLRNMARYYLSLGDLQKAGDHVDQMQNAANPVGRPFDVADVFYYRGLVLFGQGEIEPAQAAFQEAAQRYPVHQGQFKAQARIALGRTYLAQHDWEPAAQSFQEALALIQSENHAISEDQKPPLADALSGLEIAHTGLNGGAADAAQKFRAYCREMQATGSQESDAFFNHWCLEPTEAADFPEHQIEDAFVESLLPDWTWLDPFGDCSFKVGKGLEMYAANGRDLWFINRSAPRLLRPITGDFAGQIVISPTSDIRPAIGGILLWKDEETYLRLDIGTRGHHEISFMGCIENKDVVIGRGWLPAEHVFLRLERIGQQVNALCSADGEVWFTAGHVQFPVEDPVEIGLHAIGHIDRAVYCGPYPKGTATRFESFQVWKPGDGITEATDKH